MAPCQEIFPSRNPPGNPERKSSFDSRPSPVAWLPQGGTLPRASIHSAFVGKRHSQSWHSTIRKAAPEKRCRGRVELTRCP
jgi:hypothetical protein